MTDPIRVAIAGINGKMGRASALATLEDQNLELAAAFGKRGATYVGQDVGSLLLRSETGVSVSNGIDEALSAGRVDVLLDFTVAEAAASHARYAIEAGVCPVIGTSGIPEADREAIGELALKQRLGAMIIPNFSVGAVLMMDFARQAGRVFSHVEIVEMHHLGKVDAPSGTAMHTVSRLEAERQHYNPAKVDEKELIAGCRGGRRESGIRVHCLRLPGLLSHQEVIFAAEGELFTIRHDSFNTSCFKKGILMCLQAVVKLDRLVVGLDHLLELKLKPKEVQGV